MDTPLLLLLMIAFAFLADTVERRVMGDRFRSLGGAEYLLVGAMFGPLGLGVIGADRLSALDSAFALAAGLIGFSMGLSLPSRSALARRADVRFGVVNATLIAAIVGITAYIGLRTLGFGPTGLVEAAMTLGFAAAISSSAVGVVARDHRADGPVAQLLPTASAIMRLVAVVGFGAALAASPSLHDPLLGFSASWIGVAVIAGVGAGLVFHVFVGTQSDPQMLLVASLGLVALIGGMGEVLRLEPLLLGVFAGLTVAISSDAAPRIRATTLRLERPTLVVIFLYGGTRLHPQSLTEWLLPLAFVALRLIALRIASPAAARTHDGLDKNISRLGRGFAVQGALAATVAVSYGHAVGGDLGRIVEMVLLLAAVISTPLSWSSASDLLKDAGETGRARPDAVNAP
ncbi:MAG: hypothetical protein ACI9OJ_001660 [Myxococcota bacterium]|jgi:hypothetical protein